MMFSARFIYIVFVLIITINSYAQNNLHKFLYDVSNYPKVIQPYNVQNYDQQLNHIYQTVLFDKRDDVNARVIKVSDYFLGKHYVLGPLGEGYHGEFDQQPLYRTDAFDCMTFVETTLALAKAKNFGQFQTIIKKIRYNNGQVSFLARNHFTSVDWNRNNQRAGFIKDITNQFAVPYNTTDTLIDKPNWYRTLPTSTFKLLHPLDQQRTQFLVNKFRENARKVKPIISHTNYLPLTVLFVNTNGYLQPNQKIFEKIPSPAIIEIVRSNYDLTKNIGTHLDVSHLGFAIRTKQGLMFREASEINGETMDIPLTDYLLGYYKFVRHPEHIGINIEEIL